MHILVHDLDDSLKTPQEAIEVAGAKLLEKQYITPEYITACIEREKDYPTGLLMTNGLGIAIPHGDYKLVNTNAISLVRSINGVVFGQMDDSDSMVTCQLIFNLALATSDQHLSILKRLFNLFQDCSFTTACQYQSCEKVSKFITQQLTEE